ncbi:MAG: phosphate ABC transporter permease subunit PstC [Alphaproteobacteria bacterium]|nr:phosphate ABC transporter permease subunit PstC [Alphaproteobacteria bacterium]
MTDISLTQTNADFAARAETARKAGAGDTRFRLVALGAAFVVVLVFAGVIISLLAGAMPAIKAFGLSFVWTEAWSPTEEEFGALASVYGTLVTSFLAMLIAVPVGIGIAIFLTELCPRMLRRPIAIAIELLAGIPSIIYGIWGLFVFAPWFQANFEMPIIEATDGIPVIGTLFGGAPYGIGVFTASIILSIMILPFISAVTRDVFETVPSVLKEAAYGLGCTTWEVMWRICLPYTRTGVVGGGMLALGRALGETMAVTFVIGNAHNIDASLFSPGTTISATIANEFTEATGDLYTSSLIAMGLILFVITFIVLASAQLMLRTLERRQGK